MQQVELTTKLVLAIIGLTSVGAILVPTYAVPTIKSADIFDETILSADIKNGEVKNSDLGTDAVTSGKIKNGEVKAEDIAAGVIPSGGALPNVHTVTKGGTVAAGDSVFAIAQCPDGEKVTGGGYLALGLVVPQSRPENDNAWTIHVVNLRDDLDLHYEVYAVCMGPSP